MPDNVKPPNKPNKPTIYSIGLHETIVIAGNKGSNRITVTRVPGGWLYHCFIVRNPYKDTTENTYTTTFVPYSSYLLSPTS